MVETLARFYVKAILPAFRKTERIPALKGQVLSNERIWVVPRDSSRPFAGWELFIYN
jgi:hypothetical protein